MKLNREELKISLYNFNSISNRLLQADYNDYSKVVTKFVAFVRESPIIFEYIIDCGPCQQDMKVDFDEVSSGDCIFTLGNDDNEEVRNVYAILEYVAEKGIEIHYGVARSYSSSPKYQDMIKAFNDRVVMVLIRHIERHLSTIGIRMGLDDKVVYSITVQNGQVNIANDNATITATSTIGIDASQLKELTQAVRDTAKGFSPEDAETLFSHLEVVEEEAKSSTPRKAFLKTAITGLNMLKGSAEFAAAIVALIQFIQPLLL